MLSVFVVDDEAIERKYLKNIFKKHPTNFRLAGEAANGLQAIQSISSSRPDVIIMDIKMPLYDGLTAAKEIKKQYDPVLILNSAYSEFSYAQEAINLKLDAYLLKPASEQEIISTIATCVGIKNHKTTLLENLFSVKAQNFPFYLITNIVDSIIKKNYCYFKHNSDNLLKFYKKSYLNISDYKIHLLNSTFSIMMAIKESFNQRFLTLLNSEYILYEIALEDSPEKIIMLLEDFITKVKLIMEAEIDTADCFSDRVKGYLEKNFSHDITLELLGQVFNYSPPYISRKFHLETGMTISDYIITLRMEHAKELLQNSNYPIKTVSTLSGYKNISHFNRSFKEYFDVTPTTIREKRGN